MMRSWLLILLTVALGGCAGGYKLGPTNGVAPGSRSVKIKPFVNKTQEPRITEYMSTSMRRVLQQDGTFRLETSGSPDILVSGEIIRFDRVGLAYQQGDVLTPAQYTLILQCRISATDINTGKVFMSRMVQGSTYIQIGNDEYTNEREAIPILTDKLAHNAVSLLVDGAW